MTKKAHKSTLTISIILLNAIVVNATWWIYANYFSLEADEYFWSSVIYHFTIPILMNIGYIILVNYILQKNKIDIEFGVILGPLLVPIVFIGFYFALDHFFFNSKYYAQSKGELVMNNAHLDEIANSNYHYLSCYDTVVVNPIIGEHETSTYVEDDEGDYYRFSTFCTVPVIDETNTVRLWLCQSTTYNDYQVILPEILNYDTLLIRAMKENTEFKLNGYAEAIIDAELTLNVMRPEVSIDSGAPVMTFVEESYNDLMNKYGIFHIICLVLLNIGLVGAPAIYIRKIIKNASFEEQNETSWLSN